MKANQLNILPLSDGSVRVDITLADRTGLEHLVMLANTCTEFDVEIKKHYAKRSLTANGTLWRYMSLIGSKIGSTKDEVYLEMLKRYSHEYTHIVVKPEAVEQIKREWRTVEEVGPLEVNGKDGVQLKCYYGSSTFDSKQFSTLLDGVLTEAKELGIPGLDEKEFDRLIDQFEGSE